VELQTDRPREKNEHNCRDMGCKNLRLVPMGIKDSCFAGPGIYVTHSHTCMHAHVPMYLREQTRWSTWLPSPPLDLTAACTETHACTCTHGEGPRVQECARPRAQTQARQRG